VAGRELAEHAQLFAEFIEQQRRNRSKVIDCTAVVLNGLRAVHSAFAFIASFFFC